MASAVVLINSNVSKPPVSPVGLEYIGETLIDADVPLRVSDLSFESDWKACLQRELQEYEPLAIGLSVRNTDDCSFATRKSFLPWINDLVAELRKLTDAPVFLGGNGFSTLPEIVLEATTADAGIAGDGEEAFLALVRSLQNGESFNHLPNLVYWHEGKVICNPRAYVDPRYLPIPRRRIFDNRRYEQLGAMVGIETKRGCPQRCIFCADPLVKGNKLRLRPPEIVVQELKDLADQGVSWLHTCDSEFNLPIEHAKDICRAIIQGGLGNRIRWYCYCSPVPFDEELADLMNIAGCAGINFGVDSLCDEQLYRLGRIHSSEDVQKLVSLLRSKGMNYMLDLLAGGPGETVDTLRTTINRAKEFNVPLVGIAAGIRVYPDTPLGKAIADGRIIGGLHPAATPAPHEPIFYLSPLLGDNVPALIEHLANNDPRFLFLAAPAEKGSCNYADDEGLSHLIRQGARGAYWDIIRKNRSA